jgi:hypothetical protein
MNPGIIRMLAVLCNLKFPTEIYRYVSPGNCPNTPSWIQVINEFSENILEVEHESSTVLQQKPEI